MGYIPVQGAVYTSVVETNITADSVLLPEEIPPEGEVKLIKDALKSPEKSIIAGKIVKVIRRNLF